METLEALTEQGSRTDRASEVASVLPVSGMEAGVVLGGT